MDILKLLNNRDYKFEKILKTENFFIVYDNGTHHRLGDIEEYIAEEETKLIHAEYGSVKFINNYDVEILQSPTQKHNRFIDKNIIKTLETNLKICLRKTVAKKLAERGHDCANEYKQQCAQYDLIKEYLQEEKEKIEQKLIIGPVTQENWKDYYNRMETKMNINNTNTYNLKHGKFNMPHFIKEHKLINKNSNPTDDTSSMGR